MTDRQFLMWIWERLHFVYGESENLDFMRRLKAIAIQQTETTDWMGLPGEQPYRKLDPAWDGSQPYGGL